MENLQNIKDWNAPIESNINCAYHPQEKITNFCFSSLKALCPECIDYHSKLMKEKGIFPELDSFKGVRMNCMKKCFHLVEILKQESKKIDDWKRPNFDDILENATNEIKKARERLFLYIKQYTDQLIKMVTEDIDKVVYFSKETPEIQLKIQHVIKEVEKLILDTDSKDCIPAIQKICVLDMQGLVNSIRGEIDFFMQKRDLRINSYKRIKIDDSKLILLQNLISGYINVSKDYEILSTNTENNTYYEDSEADISISDAPIFHPQKSEIENSLWKEKERELQKERERKIQLKEELIQKQKEFEGIKEKKNFDPNTSFNPPKRVSFEQSTTQEKSDFVKFHTEFKNDINERFPVTNYDYFKKDVPRILHFFQNHDNILHCLDLDDLNSEVTPNFQSIELKIDFKIPAFHKSISTPDGKIYLIGGSETSNQSIKSSYTYNFDWIKRSLIPKAKMHVARSSFAICYHRFHIFVAGGLTHNSQYTNSCEKYDILSDKWIKLADFNCEVVAPCICSFNNDYIFKFGGKDERTGNNCIIERFDIKKNQWNVLDFKIEGNLDQTLNFRILSTSCCVQINTTDIYVFGGYLENNKSSNQTFILSVEDLNRKTEYTIKYIGIKTLPSPEAFWNNFPIVFNSCVYALQNIHTSEQEEICLDDKRKVLVFDSRHWIEY